MKLNKYIISLSAILLLTGLFCSCDDWLDYQPKDKQTENQQFATKEGFYAAVNGAYNRMGKTSLYGSYLSYEFIDLIGQRYTVTKTDEGTHSLYLRALINWQYSNTAVTPVVSSIWTEAFSTIMNINVILENIEKDAEGSKVLPMREYKMLKGEMLAARAMLHFDMLRLFGPVYSKKPEADAIPYNESTETQILTILPAQTVLRDYILRDLNLAKELLLESDPVITEGPRAEYDLETMDNSMRYRQLRLNYYATVLLTARAYLWDKDYTNALAEARKLTDDPKVRSFFPAVDPGTLLANTSDPDRMFSTECLFGMYNKNRGLIYDNTFGGASTGVKLLIPRKNYVNELFAGVDNGDYRYQSQWEAGLTLAEESSMRLTKFKDIVDTNKDQVAEGEEEVLKTQNFYGTFCSLIKLSEAYYIAAEVLGNSNSGVFDNQAAFNYLNQMRELRGTPARTSGDLTDLITKEYIREFIGEGQIFFYFKRLNKGFDDPYNGCQTFGPFPPFIVTDGANDAEKERRFVVPLPESELNNR